MEQANMRAFLEQVLRAAGMVLVKCLSCCCMMPW